MGIVMKSNKEINHIHSTNYSNRDKDSQDFILGTADEHEIRRFIDVVLVEAIALLVRRSA